MPAMAKFGRQLSRVLTDEEESQASFARRTGIKPTHLNRLLLTARPIRATTAARILEGVAPKYRAALVAAYIDDELAKLDLVRCRMNSKKSQSCPAMVQVGAPAGHSLSTFPIELQNDLYRFGEMARADKTLLRALEAFLEAMLRKPR
jgi:transcriptional regulator with XRE-family HTH domain